LAVFQGNYSEARSLLEEAREAFRAVGNKVGMAAATLNLGEAARYQGDYARAEEHYRESLGIFGGLGSRVGVLQALSNIGHMLYLRGDLPGARATFVEAIGLAQETDARKLAAEVLTGLSSVVLAEAGDQDQVGIEGIEQAVRLLGLTSTIVEQSGRQLEPVDQAEFDRNLAFARDVLELQEFNRAWEEGRALNLGKALDLANPAPDAEQSPGAIPLREQIPGGLTEREMEVAMLVAQGLTNQAIAQQLVLSKRTVEMHVSNALHRLGLARRTELAAWALGGGIATD
jgi:non-specific serine/threonine protein kinase